MLNGEINGADLLDLRWCSMTAGLSFVSVLHRCTSCLRRYLSLLVLLYASEVCVRISEGMICRDFGSPVTTCH